MTRCGTSDCPRDATHVVTVEGFEAPLIRCGVCAADIEWIAGAYGRGMRVRTIESIHSPPAVGGDGVLPARGFLAEDTARRQASRSGGGEA